MILTILSQQWKAFWRSRNVGKSLAMQLFAGFMILYLLGSCLLLGIYLPRIFRMAFPGQDVTPVFCGYLLYYFIADLGLRYLVQELPVLAVRPYLTLRIRRRQLVAFLNIRSLFHFTNLLPVILLFPFITGTIAPAAGPLAATVFAAGILLLTATNHFFLLYVKRQTILSSRWFFGFLLGFAALMTFDSLGWLPIRHVSAFLFTHLLRQPGWILVPVSLFSLAFLVHRRFLLRHLYLEDLSSGKKFRRSADYSWLRQLGLKGELMGLDLKIMLRSKRARYCFFISMIVPLYGLMVFKTHAMMADRIPLTTMAAFLMTGAFLINYGQSIFAWQSIHFDGLLTANIDLATYIRAKMTLLTAISTIEFIVCTAYGFLDWHLLVILLAAWLYNIGLNTVLTVYLGTYKYKGVDLKEGNLAFQGATMSVFLNIIAVMLVPVLLVAGFSALGLLWTGVLLTGGVGLLFLLLRNWWVGLLVREFNKRKYLILQGFRELK